MLILGTLVWIAVGVPYFGVVGRRFVLIEVAIPHRFLLCRVVHGKRVFQVRACLSAPRRAALALDVVFVSVSSHRRIVLYKINLADCYAKCQQLWFQFVFGY